MSCRGGSLHSAVVIAMLGFSGNGVAQTPVGPRAHVDAAGDAVRRSQRLELPSLRALAAPPPEVRLAAPGINELALPDTGLGPARTGVHRTLGREALDSGRWDVLDNGGRVWRLAVHSPGAVGIRFHFRDFAAARGRLWVHDGERREPRIMGPYSGRGPFEDGDFWSDIVLADTAVVEFEPEQWTGNSDPPPFRITEISHLAPGVLPLKSGGVRPASAPCNLDVSCYPNWADTAKAVGHIVFEKGEGSYVCSGTLLETRNHSGTPYFLTADHCISEDAVARTVQAFWFYQSSSCNGAPANRRDAPRTLGARYLAGGGRAEGDFTLLRLNSVPDGVVFSGWDPREILEGSDVTVIHHPSGDYKRISFGVRVASAADKYYAVRYSSGVTEGGSSGSGLFSAPGILVGDLSNGPKADTPEGYCTIGPFVDNFGRFSAAYPALRDYLEERIAAPPPAPPPSTNARLLVSGAAQSFSIDPVSGPTLVKGASGYQIAVPQGATRLEIRLTTTTPGVDLDLFARAGSEPEISSGSVVADYNSSGPTGNETIVITPASTPPLAAGTYYVAIAVFTPNTAITGSITATVTSGAPAPPPPPAGGPAALTSGQARNFTIASVSRATLLYGDLSYTIAVPQGATKLEIKLATATPGVDIDLYARFGTDTALSSGDVVADHKSSGPDGNELITITPSSSPPLRAGTYYISLAIFTTGVSASGTITATVTTAAAPPPPPPAGGPAALTSGQARNFTIASVSRATLLYGDLSYTIAVPQGATKLEIKLATATPGVDIDLYARFGTDTALSSGNVVSDHSSAGPDGNELITITPSSSPPLRAGTYYISLAIFTTGVTASGTITATVTTGTPPPPPSAGPVVLTSGAAQSFSLPAVDTPTLIHNDRSFVIDVPQGATRLDIQLVTATPGVDVDLFARFGRDPEVANGDVVADHSSTGPAGIENLSITASTNPPLRAGRYYISLAVYTTGTAITGRLTAAVTTSAAPPPTAATVLASGVPARFDLPAVDSPTLFMGEYSFKVTVPEGATKLRIQVASVAPSVDVDLYVRYESDTDLDADGEVVADWVSDDYSGNEFLTITPSSVPPLRPGTYYISLGLFTANTPSSGTVTATIERGVATPAVSAARPLVSGVVTPYTLPAATRATFYNGDYGFRIVVPPGTAKLEVALRTEPASVDVDLFVRYGAEPELSDGRILTDYRSTSDTGNEYIIVQATTVPPLRPGVYFIGLAVYSTNVTARGTITATVTPEKSGELEELRKADARGVLKEELRKTDAGGLLKNKPLLWTSP